MFSAVCPEPFSCPSTGDAAARFVRRREWTENKSFESRARLVNHLRRHVSQSVNLFFYLPTVSHGILAGEFFLYSEVFIWVIVAVRDACCVEERDQTVFRINAHLFDNKTDAEITDCVTRFKVTLPPYS